MHRNYPAWRGSDSSTHRWGLLQTLYPVPDPLDSSDAWDRYRHLDLVAMTKARLLLERDRVVWRLIFDSAPPAWLLERLDKIDGRLADGH